MDQLRPILLALLLACRDATGCTDIGCEGGLSVALSAAPLGPFTVTATVPGNQEARYTINCPNGMPCTLYFPGLTPYLVTIEVTSAAGTTNKTFSPTYTVERPNGAGCAPECRSATVTI